MSMSMTAAKKADGIVSRPETEPAFRNCVEENKRTTRLARDLNPQGMKGPIMTDFGIIYVLAGFTLLAGLGIGAWQLARVRRAKRQTGQDRRT